MYCSQCGVNVIQNAAFCQNCGTPVSTNYQTGWQPQGLVGFSNKIQDPAFTKYKRNSNSWSAIFAIILAVIAIIAFPIYGNASGEIDWPQSLYYGMGIGGMFIVIAIMQIIKRSSDKTWDGVIVDKKHYRERDNNDDGHMHTHEVYVLKIKKDSGRVKKHKWRDIPGPYGYYQIGDRVRHHKGFYYYEKYDKSRDSEIMCTACNSFNDIRQDVCQRCKCPLLK